MLEIPREEQIFTYYSQITSSIQKLCLFVTKEESMEEMNERKEAL